MCLDIRDGTHSGRPNEVLEQASSAGEVVKRGSTVTITVTPAGLHGTIYEFVPPAGCEEPLNAVVG
jgi:hypothetical protein